MNEVIGELQRDEKSIIRVTLNEFKGLEYLHIRTYYLNDSKEWAPTKKGISILTKDYGTLMSILESAKSKISSNNPKTNATQNKQSQT